MTDTTLKLATKLIPWGRKPKLKSCPFCGGGNECVGVDMFCACWSVSCENCGCDIGKHKTEQYAREAWNTRVEPVPVVADLSKCPKCKGAADNGFDRCDPPNVYNCTKCENTMPERIYVHTWHDRKPENDCGEWVSEKHLVGLEFVPIEYVRANIQDAVAKERDAFCDINVKKISICLS